MVFKLKKSYFDLNNRLKIAIFLFFELFVLMVTRERLLQQQDYIILNVLLETFHMNQTSKFYLDNKLRYDHFSPTKCDGLTHADNICRISTTNKGALCWSVIVPVISNDLRRLHSCRELNFQVTQTW